MRSLGLPKRHLAESILGGALRARSDRQKSPGRVGQNDAKARESGYASSLTELLSVPIPSISTSQTSPSFISPGSPGVPV